ncbi:amidohydrolase [Verrucomicrobia bacterium LW23]|nr:amidohydrolase [Verrucomicrobia bacterium LW23]
MSTYPPARPNAVPHPRLGYPVFDIEVHSSPPDRESIAKYLPQRYRERYARGYVGPAQFGFSQRGGGHRTDGDVPGEQLHANHAAPVRRYLLEPFDIEWAICTGNFYFLSALPDADYAAALASAFNNWTVNEFVVQDPCLLAAITLAPQDPALAVREIERWAGHPRVVEIIVPTVSCLPLGNRLFHPIYEAAAACGLPVAAHPTHEGKGIAPPPTAAGYPATYLEFHTGLAANAVTHAASLVCEGVFAKYPDFQFVLLEGGISWMLPLMWELDADWKRLRAEMPLLKEKPSDYLKRQFFYTTQPIEEPKATEDLLHTYEMIGGATQIMFSSDFPHWDFDDPFRILPGKTGAELKRRILRENARRLYGRKLAALESAVAVAEAA